MRIAGHKDPTVQVTNSTALTLHLQCPPDAGRREFNVREPITELSGPESPKVQASVSARRSGGTTLLFPASKPLFECRAKNRWVAGSQQPGNPDTIRDVLDRMAGVLAS